MGERSRATTIADVAAHAGVSQASVSRVLNGKQSVDPVIVQRVQASIAALGYSPSSPPAASCTGATTPSRWSCPTSRTRCSRASSRG